MNTLTRLKIDKFRSVKPGTELHFSPGVNVLLGQNGTGKTTLLELISMAQRWDFSAMSDEEFSIELAWQVGDNGLLVKLRGARSDFGSKELRAPVQPELMSEIQLLDNKEDPPLFRLTSEGGRGVLTVRGGRTRSFIHRLDSDLLFRVLLLELFLEPELATFATKVDSVLATPGFRFDESLGVFNALVFRDPSPPHHGIPGLGQFEVQSWAKTGDGKPMVTGTLVPDGVMNAFFRHFSLDSADGGRTTISLSADSEPAIPFLNDFRRLCHLRDVEMSISLLEKTVSRGLIRQRWGKLSFIFTKRDGSSFSHDSLSYGQKRLLAFLYYLDAVGPGGPVVADELVNGMHHAWIKSCVDALKGRQAFLTSQNPLLLDFLEFASAEQARQSFIVCKLEEEGDHDVMVWENLSDDDAERFFRSYEVGIQHVGEILRTEGLW